MEALECHGVGLEIVVEFRTAGGKGGEKRLVF